MNRVSVKIDGVDYQIAGEKNEAEIVKVAKYIDGEFHPNLGHLLCFLK